jgi:methyltransferase (TIGR00027 family)
VTTASTAHWIAAVRARETARSDPLFTDPYAHTLAGQLGYTIMAASEGTSGGENVFIPVRVRWFDDTIEAGAVAGTQVVLLGAGLDTRPYRLTLPGDLDWYELDRAEIFAAKEPVLAAETARCRRHVVIADLAEAWVPALRAAGFDASRATIWVAEGLLFYLTLASITALLRATAELSAPGSRFLADVLPGHTAEWVAGLRNGRSGSPAFGHDDPDVLFASGGWSVVRATPAGAARANYGRMRPLPDNEPRAGHAHLVEATPFVHSGQ